MTRKTINRRSFLAAAAGLIGGGLGARAAFPAAERSVHMACAAVES